MVCFAIDTKGQLSSSCISHVLRVAVGVLLKCCGMGRRCLRRRWQALPFFRGSFCSVFPSLRIRNELVEFVEAREDLAFFH